MNNQNPPLLKRDDYKTLKHMNREDLTKYLYRIYRRGFDAGVESTKARSPSVPSYRLNRRRRRNKSWEGVCRTI